MEIPKNCEAGPVYSSMSAKYAPWYHSTPATPECRMPETGTGRGIPITEFERDSGDNLTYLSKQFGRINMEPAAMYAVRLPHTEIP